MTRAQSSSELPSDLGALKADWEVLASMDPLWAILTDPTKKGGGWSLEDFFHTGHLEVAQVMRWADQRQLPQGREALLDFGCGIGRLTRAFSPHFAQCVGLDISEGMIREACRHNGHLQNCRFLTNNHPDLRKFPSDSFDMIYTNIVLQHLPSRAAIAQYVRDFVRVLRPHGLLVFQLPSSIPWTRRLMLRRRLYRLLKWLGVSDKSLHFQNNLTTIRMISFPTRQVAGLLSTAGGTLLDVSRVKTEASESATYYVTKR